MGLRAVERSVRIIARVRRKSLPPACLAQCRMVLPCFTAKPSPAGAAPLIRAAPLPCGDDSSLAPALRTTIAWHARTASHSALGVGGVRYAGAGASLPRGAQNRILVESMSMWVFTPSCRTAAAGGTCPTQGRFVLPMGLCVARGVPDHGPEPCPDQAQDVDGVASPSHVSNCIPLPT